MPNLYLGTVAHSIRDDARNGFLLPYQQLLAEAPQGLDLAPFVARAPGEHFDEFSYGSELVSHDGTIAALTELARVVELLPDVVDGPWDAVGIWIGERLADAWHARGPYPGMGPLLAAAGLERGPVLARRVLDNLPAGVTNPWPELENVIAQDRYGLVGRKARKAWERVKADADRYRQLRIMSRFGLTSEVSGDAVIALLAFAMGVRNATIRRVAVPDLTTTVLTMTLTGLAADSQLFGGSGKGSVRRTTAVLAMLLGALAGALLLKTSLFLPLAVAAALAFITFLGYPPAARREEGA